MDARESSLRVLMFPWLAHGHVFPFLELAKNLSKRNFQIYFCSTPIILDSVRASLNNNDNDNDNDNDNRIDLVELHLPSLPELPPHYHTTNNLPPHLIYPLINSFQASAPAFSVIITGLHPDLLIYDGFEPWAARRAAALGIPPVYFSTSGSASQSFSHHIHTHKDWDTFPFDAIRLREHEKRARVSRKEAIKIKNDDGDFFFGVYKLSCEIVLIKSYRGIEGKYMDYLSTLCERKLVPTGPLIVHGGGGGDEEGGGSEILKWLSRREKGSTLYISFGSEEYLSKKQMMEVAKGLEASGVSFIWVARSPAGDGSAAVLEGFAERMRERGMVVERWAPQTAILAHESVGGFMSHCGWSSVTESLYYGVPVVAIPFKTDQPVNARLVVEAGVGVEVERDEESGEFDGEGVAKAIEKVFVEEREGMRSRAREMREKMKMEEEEAMDGVVAMLSRLCTKKSVIQSRFAKGMIS